MLKDELIAKWFVNLVIASGNVELSVLLLFVGALLVALVLHSVLFFALSRIFSGGTGRVIVKSVRSPARLSALLLSVVVLLPAANFSPSISEWVYRLLTIGLLLLLGWTVALVINAAAKRIEKQHRIDHEHNLEARRIHTQLDILRRIALTIVWLITAGAVLLSFPAVRALGVSLFASAGAAGLVLGFAARPVLANLIAGLQIALTTPIRIDDVVIVEGEWGWIEKISSTYVIIRIWDLRRLVVPLAHFIEKPFENWTRENAEILGSVFWHVDYRAPIDAMRHKLNEIVATHDLWDKKVVNLQVVESGPQTLTVRALVSARTSPRAWDLRCDVREAMISWLREAHPEALPQIRGQIAQPQSHDAFLGVANNATS